MSLDDVYVFKVLLKLVTSVSVAYVLSILLVNVSIESNLPPCDPLLVSNESTLPSNVEISLSKEPVLVSSDPNLLFCVVFVVSKLPVFVSIEDSLLF